MLSPIERNGHRMFDDHLPIQDSEEDLGAARENARTRFRAWRLRSLYSAVALLMDCAFVVPFLYGHSLHTYWESFGKYLVLVAMALLVVLVYCAGLLWGAWVSLSDLRKMQTPH